MAYNLAFETDLAVLSKFSSLHCAGSIVQYDEPKLAC